MPTLAALAGHHARRTFSPQVRQKTVDLPFAQSQTMRRACGRNVAICYCLQGLEPVDFTHAHGYDLGRSGVARQVPGRKRPACAVYITPMRPKWDILI